MSIICKICNTEFDKIIPWQHLKTHQVSTADYKIKFGSVYSAETLAKFESRIPHNKGTKVTDPAKLKIIRAATDQREVRFQNGEFSRGAAKTNDQKQELSIKSTEYAANNRDEIQQRAIKATATKIKNNYDFGSNMRGKKHTESAKQLISDAAVKGNQKKSENAIINAISQIDECKLTLLSDINLNPLQLQCNECTTKFTFTRQYFTAVNKLKLDICPTCFPRSVNVSKSELEIFNFIHSLCPDAISSYRTHYHSKELDIYIPSLNIGVEFNGLYWHSEQVLLANNRSATCDHTKQQDFDSQGIRVINIFEDEWEHKQDIVRSRIISLLGKSTTKIYARKCHIREVSSKDASIFCNTNHIMGKGRSNFRVGLYFDNELVSLMTFVTNNISRKLINTWEINRFASKLNTSVVGSASRLFKYFITRIMPSEVISYSDNRWSTGGLYNQLGFIKHSNGVPNYWYVATNTTVRTHRYTLRKNKDDDQSLTEYQNRQNQGYLRIWDCGSSKWIWKSK